MTTTTMHPEKDQQKTTTTSNLTKKPPLPPKQPTTSTIAAVPVKSEQTKSKGNHIQNRIDDENAQQIQRLIAMNDKLNLELASVRKALHDERLGVRGLR